MKPFLALILYLTFGYVATMAPSQKGDPLAALPPVLCARDGRFVLSLIRGADPSRPELYFIATYDTNDLAVDFWPVDPKRVSFKSAGGGMWVLNITVERPKDDPFTGLRAGSVTATWQLRSNLSSGKAMWAVSYAGDTGDPLPESYPGNFIREGKDFSAAGEVYANPLGCL